MNPIEFIWSEERSMKPNSVCMCVQWQECISSGQCATFSEEALLAVALVQPVLARRSMLSVDAMC